MRRLLNALLFLLRAAGWLYLTASDALRRAWRRVREFLEYELSPGRRY